MKELFYNGLNLEKDLEFCSIMRELEQDSHVLFLFSPESCLIHHMSCVLRSPGRFDRTRETHVGYGSHYVTFAYKGFIFYIQAGTYYPFTDENHPGKFNFLVHRRLGRAQRVQCSYFEAYEGIHSISEWLEHEHPKRIPDAPMRNIDLAISEGNAKQILRYVSMHGGAREKSVASANPWFLPTETWNNDHKVVRVVSDSPDPDGHRDAFEFDVVTQMICG